MSTGLTLQSEKEKIPNNLHCAVFFLNAHTQAEDMYRVFVKAEELNLLLNKWNASSFLQKVVEWSSAEGYAEETWITAVRRNVRVFVEKSCPDKYRHLQTNLRGRNQQNVSLPHS